MYPEIITLIDRQLAKLFEVRTFLSAPDRAEEPQPAAAEILPVPDAPVLPRKVRSSLRGMTKRPRIFRRREPELTALRGAVPAGPVVAAPSMVRARQTSHGPAALGVAAEPPSGTLDELVRDLKRLGKLNGV